MEEYT